MLFDSSKVGSEATLDLDQDTNPIANDIENITLINRGVGSKIGGRYTAFN
ncbi:MAG TPA: hypothetical protein V6C71_07925 [Coleofasciculaceae cyanobacterium]|jgi:hypothetical protein